MAIESQPGTKEKNRAQGQTPVQPSADEILHRVRNAVGIQEKAAQQAKIRTTEGLRQDSRERREARDDISTTANTYTQGTLRAYFAACAIEDGDDGPAASNFVSLAHEESALDAYEEVYSSNLFMPRDDGMPMSDDEIFGQLGIEDDGEEEPEADDVDVAPPLDEDAPAEDAIEVDPDGITAAAEMDDGQGIEVEVSPRAAFAQAAALPESDNDVALENGPENGPDNEPDMTPENPKVAARPQEAMAL